MWKSHEHLWFSLGIDDLDVPHLHHHETRAHASPAHGNPTKWSIFRIPRLIGRDFYYLIYWGIMITHSIMRWDRAVFDGSHGVS